MQLMPMTGSGPPTRAANAASLLGSARHVPLCAAHAFRSTPNARPDSVCHGVPVCVYPGHEYGEGLLHWQRRHVKATRCAAQVSAAR